MNFKRIWWMGASLGLLLSAAGCSEVDHCKDGAKGCLGGECKTDDDCKFDLECVRTTSGAEAVCGVKKGSKYDCGSAGACEKPTPDDGDGGMPEPIPCNCTGEDEVCAPGTSDVCINYCIVPEPGFIPPRERQAESLPCRLDEENKPVSYEVACRATLKQICLRSQVFCGAPACDPSVWQAADAVEQCEAKFGATDDEIYTACETIRDTTNCDAFTECPAEFPLDCSDKANFVCTNTCRFADDGACDDGEILTAAYAECDWGTDCGDCGPRVGKAPSRAALGEQCLVDKQCEGYSADLRRNKAWCIFVDAFTGVPADTVLRCMPDCTRDEQCPEGFRCAGISVNGEPFMQDDLTARVCNPVICQ